MGRFGIYRIIALVVAAVVAPACTSTHGRGVAVNSNDQFLLDMTMLHAALELSPEQEPLWKQVDSTTGQMLRQGAINRNNTKEQLRTKLTNPKVELQPLVDLIKGAMSTQNALASKTLDQWLALDAGLSDPQKATLRKFLHGKVEQSEELDARINRLERRMQRNGDDDGYGRWRGRNRFNDGSLMRDHTPESIRRDRDR